MSTLATKRRATTLNDLVRAEDPRRLISAMPHDDLIDLAMAYVGTVKAQRSRAVVRSKETIATRVPLSTRKAAVAQVAQQEAVKSGRAAYKQIMIRKFEPLLDQRIDLGGGRATTWGHATAEDHASRIGMLREHAGGIERTIGLHREAVEALHELGLVSLEWLVK